MATEETVRAELARTHDMTLLAYLEASFTSGKKDLKKVKSYPVALASKCDDGLVGFLVSLAIGIAWCYGWQVTRFRFLPYPARRINHRCPRWN